jgi:hypothetical protein
LRAVIAIGKIILIRHKYAISRRDAIAMKMDGYPIILMDVTFACLMEMYIL